MIYHDIICKNGYIFLYAFEILNKKMQESMSCISNNLTDNKITDDKKFLLDASLIIPCIINSAFACELLMKSMIKDKVRTHDLKKLFELMDSDTQKIIKNKVIENMRKFDKTYIDENFKNDLIKNSNVFIEWRYFYEKRDDSLQVNYQFISYFLKSICDTINI